MRRVDFCNGAHVRPRHCIWVMRIPAEWERVISTGQWAGTPFWWRTFFPHEVSAHPPRPCPSVPRDEITP